MLRDCLLSDRLCLDPSHRWQGVPSSGRMTNVNPRRNASSASAHPPIEPERHRDSRRAGENDEQPCVLVERHATRSIPFGRATMPLGRSLVDATRPKKIEKIAAVNRTTRGRCKCVRGRTRYASLFRDMKVRL